MNFLQNVYGHGLSFVDPLQNHGNDSNNDLKEHDAPDNDSYDVMRDVFGVESMFDDGRDRSNECSCEE